MGKTHKTYQELFNYLKIRKNLKLESTYPKAAIRVQSYDVKIKTTGNLTLNCKDI